MKATITFLTVFVVSVSAQQAFAAPVEWSVADGGNGHYYEEVVQTTTWPEAKNAADLLTFNGVQGHLVTITSAAENDFLKGHFSQAFTVFWLGGFQDVNAPDYSEPDGGWRWVTGEPFVYTNWAAGEPSNSGTGSEEYLVSYVDIWQWNDFFPTGTGKGFYVEYPVPKPSTRILGDANLSGSVTGTDLLAVQANFGASGDPQTLFGDADISGSVTGADLLSVQAHFGESAGSGSVSASAVPEPS